MNIFVKVGDMQYPASITGRIHDSDWDDRSSKAIKLQMGYEMATAIFVDDVNWSIVQEVEEMVEVIDEETGEITMKPVIIEEEYDNSEYSVAGEIVDHRNGYVTVKMGMVTTVELLSMIQEVL